MIRKKICVVTGSRADYGLLYWLMREIDVDLDLELKIIATGMHLSSEFGNTHQQIESDGFVIDKKVDIKLFSDSEVGISKSMSLGMIGFAEVFNDLKPDLCVVLGDRFEIFSAVSAAMVAKVPVAHIHGGEKTEGAFDEAIRHSITKMSHLHFVATETYRNRVIQLGEQPDKVFNVGGLGIENINRLDLLSRQDFEDAIDFKLAQKNILVTYHPVTLEDSLLVIQFNAILDSIDELIDTNVIFTKANSDTNGKIINKMIDNYVKEHSNSVEFKSMGQLKYLSALQFMDAVVGNSSSALIEAPSFKIASINIGERQKGRIKAESVIDCLPDKKSISKALKLVYSKDFMHIVHAVKNPYDSGNSSKRIVKKIKHANLKNILKKSFYDISIPKLKDRL
jgi:GDP/UDP-N,N'-diacetylbacillosamine 2-epimerase (hydrolysing)